MQKKLVLVTVKAFINGGVSITQMVSATIRKDGSVSVDTAIINRLLEELDVPTDCTYIIG